MKELTGEHAFVHENMGAYLAGGLDAAERGRFDAHINNCPECFDAFSEARDADRGMQRALAELQPGERFEERLTERVRKVTMSRWRHPAIRRMGYATAAAVALAATGVFANVAMRQNGRFNNPLTQALASDADAQETDWGRENQKVTAALWRAHSDSVNNKDTLQNQTTALASTDRMSAVDRLGPPNDNRTMPMRFENAPVETVLTNMSQAFGFIIVKQVQMPQRVTIEVPNPVNRQEAISLLNEALLPLGYGTLQTKSSNAPDAKTVLHIASILETKKAQIPVHEGADPNDIPLTDELITQIIPLKNVSASSLRADLGPMISTDADVMANNSSNTIVITDTSAKIHRLTEIIQKLDNQKPTNGSSIATGEETNHRTGQEVIRQNIDTTEHLIPYADLMFYPDNWPEITRKRASGDGSASFNDEVSTSADDFKLRTLENTKLQWQQEMAAAKVGELPNSQRSDEIKARVQDIDKQIAEERAKIGGTGAASNTAGTFDTYLAPMGGQPGAKQPAAAQDIGGAALGYDAGKAYANKKDDIGFEFGKNDALRQGKDFQGNNVSMGLLGGSDFGTRGSPAQKINTYSQATPGSTGVPGSIASYAFDGKEPTVTITGGGGTGAVTIPGQIAGTLVPQVSNPGYAYNNGEFNKFGAGSVTLAGKNTYTGPTSINTLQVASGGVTLGTGVSTAGGLVNLNGGTLTTGAIANRPEARGPVDELELRASGKPSADMPAQVAMNFNGGVLRSATEDPNGADSRFAALTVVDGTGHATHAVVDQNSADGQKNFMDNHADLALMRDATIVNGDALAMATPANGTLPTGNAPTTTTPSNATPAPEIQALKIIRNGTIAFEVLSFDDAYQHIRQIAALEKGYVSSTSSDKLANGHVRGTIVVRIPPDHLDTFLISLRSLGDLKAQQIGAADVTKDYYDIESELRALTATEDRLLELLKNPNGQVKDLTEVIKQLSDVRVRMEKLKGEITYYNNLVSLATITITAYEKDIASPTAASEQESVNLNVESEEVEAKYSQARKIFDDAKGHIVESQLKNADADHVAAHIVADVPPAQADFVANQLKQLGKVASFNRDRRQTTSGGTGAPTPGVQVDEKDTHFTVELFNLANLNPRETTVLRVAVRDVEASYKTALELIKQPGTEAPAPAAAAAGAPAVAAPTAAGRVYSSNLTGQQPEQMSADINAQVRAENADALLATLRNAGMVLTSQLNTNQDPSGTTSAKRGLQVTLVNIASVNPKEADNIVIAVHDVDAAYKAALMLIRKDAPPAPASNADLALLPPTVGRVMSAVSNGQQPLAMTAEIQAQIRVDQDADLVAALKKFGEVVSSTSSENQDTVNVTRAKRGLYVHFANIASYSPRETQELHAVAGNVADSYHSLTTALQEMAARGDVRIVGSNFSDADPRSISASLTFEAQKTALDAVEKAFLAAGLEFPSRSVSRAADNLIALDSKVGFRIDDIRAAESLDPKRTITLGLEVDDVEQAVNRLRTALSGLTAGGGKVRESDFTVVRDEHGQVIAQIKLDTYLTATPTVMANISGLGMQTSYQESRDPRAPETKSFTKERIDLTLTSHKPIKPIVPADTGLTNSARAALTSALGALFLALYYILTGLLFVFPFVIIGWPIWMLMKRRKSAKA